jgi:hypothetical protein
MVDFFTKMSLEYNDVVWPYMVTAMSRYKSVEHRTVWGCSLAVCGCLTVIVLK